MQRDETFESQELSHQGEDLPAVLVVDDEPLVLGVIAKALEKAFAVATSQDGADAIAQVQRGRFTVIVSDINMPGMTGIDLLRKVREHDPDLPVLLITGQPSWEGAAQAIEYGVFRYLSKPLDIECLRNTVTQAALLYRMARLKREAIGLGGSAGPSDRAGLEAIFERALASFHMAFQPIVSLSTKSILGYEALLRSTDPSLPRPEDVLKAAARLGATRKLGRVLRRLAADQWAKMAPNWLLFVNILPNDLLDPDLVDPNSPLVVAASRVVLEINERSLLSGLEEVRERVAQLRALGFRIAVDDLGAGYAGLTSFAVLNPDIVKLDMSLIRGIEASSIKRRLVASVADLCREMKMLVVAEGVETTAERDVLSGLGCDLFQGFLFARPASAFDQPAF